MSSKRKLIKDAIKTLLIDDLIVSGRVYLNRKQVIEHEDEALVGLILVAIDSESSAVFNISPKITKRTLKVGVTLYKTQGEEDVDGVEDQLEALASLVEKKFFRWETSSLGSIASQVDYEGYEFAINEEAERLEGAIKLSYSIVYYQEEVIPEDELDDFSLNEVAVKQGTDTSFSFETKLEQ